MKIILRIILLIILVFPMSIHASNIKIMRLVTGDDGHSYLKKDTIELLPSKVGVASDEIKVKITTTERKKIQPSSEFKGCLFCNTLPLQQENIFKKTCFSQRSN